MLDVYSRMIVGWSIADHVRTDLVVRCPADGVLATATVAGHDLSWQPGQYTSWAFGHRLRQAGLPGSMGRVASVNNAMIESFWSTMQREVLENQRWDTKVQLSQAIFEWVEAWYNPRC
jgi:transposase InsO family protein